MQIDSWRWVICQWPRLAQPKMTLQIVVSPDTSLEDIAHRDSSAARTRSADAPPVSAHRVRHSALGTPQESVREQPGPIRSARPVRPRHPGAVTLRSNGRQGRYWVAVRAQSRTRGDADVGVPGHAGDVGGLQVPAEQGSRAEHLPQAVPGPGAFAVGVAPPGGQVGGRQDAAVEVGGPPVGAAGEGNISPRGLAASAAPPGSRITRCQDDAAP
jgi:hypothetical protein